LVDDLLDYEGDAHQLGKNIGDDLREGKATLPLLVALQRATPSEQALIRQAVETGEEKRLSEIVAIVRGTGALEVTRHAARQEADKARLCLDTLPDSAHRRALLEFCAGSVDRSS
jgi:octaprenyl-diphosphate synthase